MPENTPPNWDVARILGLYQSNPYAKRLLDELASNETEPAGNATSVDEVERKFDASRNDAILLLRALEDAHCGKFFTGRRGQPSRLAWSVSAIRVAKSAMEIDYTQISVPVNESDFLEHPIWLRRGVRVTLRLPADLTKDEAERLAGLVANLWMQSSE